MRLGQAAQIGFIFASAVAVYSFVRSVQNDHRLSSCSALCHFRPHYAGQNRSVPEFTLPNMEGTPVALSSLRNGKPMVLNFWTKTCQPCLEEMPFLAELTEIVATRGIKVVTICTDEGPDDIRDTLEVVLDGKPPPFEILFDPDTEVVADMFGTSLFPETWFVDGEGVIRARVDGARDWTSPFALEVLEMIERPLGCPVEFQNQQPLGPYAGLCDPS